MDQRELSAYIQVTSQLEGPRETNYHEAGSGVFELWISDFRKRRDNSRPCFVGFKACTSSRDSVRTNHSRLPRLHDFASDGEPARNSPCRMGLAHHSKTSSIRLCSTILTPPRQFPTDAGSLSALAERCWRQESLSRAPSQNLQGQTHHSDPSRSRRS